MTRKVSWRVHDNILWLESIMTGWELNGRYSQFAPSSWPSIILCASPTAAHTEHIFIRRFTECSCKNSHRMDINFSAAETQLTVEKLKYRKTAKYLYYYYYYYGSTALLLGLGRFFSFLILYTFGRTPWTGDQPVARALPTRRTTQTQNKRTQYRTPCLELDSSPRSQRSNERRQFKIIFISINNWHHQT
jgi:hypothetical protein